MKHAPTCLNMHQIGGTDYKATPGPEKGQSAVEGACLLQDCYIHIGGVGCHSHPPHTCIWKRSSSQNGEDNFPSYRDRWEVEEGENCLGASLVHIVFPLYSEGAHGCACPCRYHSILSAIHLESVPSTAEKGISVALDQSRSFLSQWLSSPIHPLSHFPQFPGEPWPRWRKSRIAFYDAWGSLWSCVPSYSTRIAVGVHLGHSCYQSEWAPWGLEEELCITLLLPRWQATLLGTLNSSVPVWKGQWIFPCNLEIQQRPLPLQCPSSNRQYRCEWGNYVPPHWY